MMRVRTDFLVAAGAAVAALLMASTNAVAYPLLFTVTGNENFSFELDSNPPTSYVTIGEQFDTTGQDFVIGTGASAQKIGAVGLIFSSSADFGTFLVYDLNSSPNTIYFYGLGDFLAGPQLYSGTEAAPVFSPGSFQLQDGTSGVPLDDTLTISAVPLPAALPMFGAAVASLAALAKRRRSAA